MKRRGAFIIIAAAGLSACAGTPAALRPQAVQAAAPEAKGYLTGPLIQALAEEIGENALAAGLHDPRFSPVRRDELDALAYSVDLLASPEPCSREDLDPRKYGVIVTSGHRRGLLLHRRCILRPRRNRLLNRHNVRRHRRGCVCRRGGGVSGLLWQSNGRSAFLTLSVGPQSKRVRSEDRQYVWTPGAANDLGPR